METVVRWNLFDVYLRVKPSVFVHCQERVCLNAFDANVPRWHGREFHYAMAVRVVVRSGHGPVRENQNIVSVPAVQFHSTAIMFERAGRRHLGAVVRFTVFTRTTASRPTRFGQRIVSASTVRSLLNVSGQGVLLVAEPCFK